ncbi:DUF1649-domain-containing protein [Exidia glandulosa HHB12029]|uniref:Autophagy-related protein 101 n=1 Tax=Exidia glandulosa HHB12029 TaxID=1314781 RepID=A0A165NWS9_EXIGL|nr:DUF1649-domain-containing protein [Exidia glandulosa HHB12029]
MDAHPVVTIDVVVDRNTAKDALRALLHAILFHRLFGTIRPTSFDVLDITFPEVDDQSIDDLIRGRVDALFRALDLDKNRRGQLVVTFSEKRPKKSGWFSSIEVRREEVIWEQWIINVEARQPKTDPERQALLRELSDTLSNALRTILEHTASDRGRAAVPLITQNSGISPFPFRVVAKLNGAELA